MNSFYSGLKSFGSQSYSALGTAASAIKDNAKIAYNAAYEESVRQQAILK